MDYNLKIIIDGVTVNEYIPPVDETDVEIDTTPSITNVKLKDSTSLNGLDIGSCASNSLYLTMLNPFKESFDGSRVEFFISAQSDPTGTADAIADGIGDEVDTSTEIEADVIDTNIEIIDAEEGEPLTPTEEAEIEAEQAEANANQYDAFEGEPVPLDPPTSTDEGEEEEWIPMGVYYVVEQRQKENGIAIACLDGFSKMAGEFEPSSRKATLPAFCADLKNQLLTNCGIVMDDLEIGTEAYPDVLDFKYPMTYRQAIGYVAGKLGGFATFGLDETLGVSFYSTSNRILMMSDMVSYSDNSAGAQTITGAICNRAFNPYKKDEIMAGDGVGIYFNNPFVTQDELDLIFDNFKGISYSGAKFTTLWENNIFAGEFVRIMTDEEYAQYVGLQNAIEQGEGDVDELKILLMQLGQTVLITNQTIDFTGVALTTVDSILPTAQKTEATPASPTDGKFRALYAEMIAAEYIDAKKVVTDALEAKDAEIQDLVAENLQVESINGNVIKEGTVLAKALSNEAVQTLGGSKVFYQAEEPTDAKAGDSWYKTVVPGDYDGKILFVYDGTQWVGKDLDAKLLQANSITAQEIASNTITSNEIASNTITADEIVGNTITANKLNLDSLATSALWSKSIDATNFNLKGGSIQIETSQNTNDKIKLTYKSGTTTSTTQMIPSGFYTESSNDARCSMASGVVTAYPSKAKTNSQAYTRIGDGVTFADFYEGMSLLPTDPVVGRIYMTADADGTNGTFHVTRKMEGTQFTAPVFMTSGHDTGLGYLSSSTRTATITANTTWKQAFDYSLKAGTWLVIAQVSTDGTVSSATNIRANLSTTSAYNYPQVSQYVPSGQYGRFQFSNTFEFSGNSNHVYLNVSATSSCTLGTNTKVTIIRLR